MKLDFVSENEEKHGYHYDWYFVHLHGKAERRTDVCIGSLSMKEVLKEVPQPIGTPLILPCTVYGEPAVCVLKSVLDKQGNNLWRGRIALISDAPSLQHALSPADWW